MHVSLFKIGVCVNIHDFWPFVIFLLTSCLSLFSFDNVIFLTVFSFFPSLRAFLWIKEISFVTFQISFFWSLLFVYGFLYNSVVFN